VESKKVTCLAILIVFFGLGQYALPAFELMGVTPFVFACALFEPIFGAKILIALYFPVVYYVFVTSIYMVEYGETLILTLTSFLDVKDFPLTPTGTMTVLYMIVFLSRNLNFFLAIKIIRKYHINERLRI